MRRSATDFRHLRARVHIIKLVAALAGCMLATAVASSHELLRAPTEALAEIRGAALGFVKSQLANSAGIASIEIGALDNRLRLARCSGALQAELPAGMTVQARTTVGVSCDGPVRWRIYVPVTVERHIPVLVLQRAVPRNAVITAADVSVETRRIAGLGAAYLESVTELDGRTLRRTLPAGTTLTVDMFAPNDVVHRGQQVTLVAASSAIEVRAAGLALEDAAAGGRLKVENLSSLRVVEGVAESSGVVRVNQ